MILQQYSIKEEIANSITHGIGFLLSFGVLGTLTAFAAVYGSALHITACSIFAFSMIFLYGASTLYHAIPIQRVKKILRIIDHSAIFVLIAGTYTPFALITVKGVLGWSIFGMIWGIAIFGIIFQNSLLKKRRYFSVILYLLSGWTVIVVIKPLFLNLHPVGFTFLLVGGGLYSFGTLFYLWKKLPYNHAIWHIFVLLGTLFHFFAILLYVVPIFA